MKGMLSAWDDSMPDFIGLMSFFTNGSLRCGERSRDPRNDTWFWSCDRIFGHDGVHAVQDSDSSPCVIWGELGKQELERAVSALTRMLEGL